MATASTPSASEPSLPPVVRPVIEGDLPLLYTRPQPPHLPSPGASTDLLDRSTWMTEVGRPNGIASETLRSLVDHGHLPATRLPYADLAGIRTAGKSPELLVRDSTLPANPGMLTAVAHIARPRLAPLRVPTVATTDLYAPDDRFRRDVVAALGATSKAAKELGQPLDRYSVIRLSWEATIDGRSTTRLIGYYLPDGSEYNDRRTTTSLEKAVRANDITKRFDLETQYQVVGRSLTGRRAEHSAPAATAPSHQLPTSPTTPAAITSATPTPAAPVGPASPPVTHAVPPPAATAAPAPTAPAPTAAVTAPAPAAPAQTAAAPDAPAPTQAPAPAVGIIPAPVLPSPEKKTPLRNLKEADLVVVDSTRDIDQTAVPRKDQTHALVFLTKPVQDYCGTGTFRTYAGVDGQWARFLLRQQRVSTMSVPGEMEPGGQLILVSGTTTADGLRITPIGRMPYAGLEARDRTQGTTADMLGNMSAFVPLVAEPFVVVNADIDRTRPQPISPTITLSKPDKTATARAIAERLGRIFDV